MTQRLNIVISLTLIVLLGLSQIDRCSSKKEGEQDIISATKFMEKEKDQVIKDTNLKPVDIESMNQNLMSERAANELLKKELEMYKRINSYVKAELISSINNLRIDFPGAEEAIPDKLLSNDSTINIDTVKKYFVRVPKNFMYSDKQWFNLSGSVDRKGILFDTISFVNKFDVTVGIKRGKRFWQKSNPTVELKSYNPYTSVPYINNVVVTQNKIPWYQSRIAFFGYGALTVYGISIFKNN